MAAAQLTGGAAVSCCLSGRPSKWEFSSRNSTGFPCFFARRTNIVRSCSPSLDRPIGFLPCPVIRPKSKQIFSRFNSHLNSESGLQSSDVEETCDPSNPSVGLKLFFFVFSELNGSISSETNEINNKLRGASVITSQSKDVRHELIMLSLPAIGGQAMEPMVQLMETAFIGRMGSVELASAGVSISLFNIIAKLFNMPLLSVATSFVAEDISKNASRISTSVEKLQLSSVSTALLLAVGIGIFEVMALCLGSGPLLSLMGISPMLVGAISSAFLLYAPAIMGLPGVWSGLTLLMGLRMMAGFFRILQPGGPWWFLRGDVKKAQAWTLPVAEFLDLCMEIKRKYKCD
ncbi:UNVERIFIED_CONTAM: protein DETOXIFICATION 45, chloroplastic [Sesamum radiatum]|uniref:Protein DETOXIFICATION 45, chloroplastic n=1 Tax=Sesamum radiatum TaxID=300843 RepID=A0AAW2MUP2_SESRA